MCGYARRHVSTRQLHELADLLNDAGIVVRRGVEELVHFYPAFGGNQSRKINDLIIKEGGHIKTVDATWWYDCEEIQGDLAVGDRTTFNARNLNSPYWKAAIRHHRAIVVCTGIGESKLIEGKKRQYLMESKDILLLGAVYRAYSNNLYSCAIITRDSHPRFDEYHDKAFPLFLPNDPEFLQLWLSDAREDEPAIANLLEHPKLFNDLTVSQVKTFKDAKLLGAPVLLAAD